MLIGRAMAQALGRRPLTAEARVRSRVSECGIYDEQSGTKTGFSLSISFHRCSITWKNEKKLIIFLFIFITRVAQSLKSEVRP
jgi:hypothetical protein